MKNNQDFELPMVQNPRKVVIWTTEKIKTDMRCETTSQITCLKSLKKMAVLFPINFKKWIDENRHLLKPPVSNKVVYKDTEFIIMVVGGPNSRKDYHFNEGEEFYYQLEGGIEVGIQENGKAVNVPIKEGEIFLLPPRIPHSPRRGPNTVGLVIERARRSGEKDGLMWFCEKCNNKLYDEHFPLTDIMTQFQKVFERFYGSKEFRTCKKCGHVMEPPAKPAEQKSQTTC